MIPKPSLSTCFRPRCATLPEAPRNLRHVRRPANGEKGPAIRARWEPQEGHQLSGHHSLFSVHVLSPQVFAAFIHGIHRITLIFTIHYLNSQANSSLFIHSNHIHKITPITRIVATKDIKHLLRHSHSDVLGRAPKYLTKGCSRY